MARHEPALPRPPALFGWWLVDQNTDYPQDTMVTGVIVIAALVMVLITMVERRA